MLTENCQLLTWGVHDVGQLGLGQSIPSTLVPTLLRLPNDKLAVEVACGTWHALALMDSGKVYAWGLNQNGQVSKLLTGDVFSPVDALNEDGLGRSTVISIVCGLWSSFALRSNGQLWTWGDNGLTGLERLTEPTMVPLDFEVSKVRFRTRFGS